MNTTTANLTPAISCPSRAPNDCIRRRRIITASWNSRNFLQYKSGLIRCTKSGESNKGGVDSRMIAIQKIHPVGTYDSIETKEVGERLRHMTARAYIRIHSGGQRAINPSPPRPHFLLREENKYRRRAGAYMAGKNGDSCASLPK